MFSRAMRVTRIWGIEVRLDPSLLLLTIGVAWAFTARFRDDHELAVAVVMAGTGALLVLLTTLAHELAHALEARHRGIEVAGITLFLFGGVTEMHAHGQSARDELAIAVVGPYVSLVCGAALGAVAYLAPDLLPASIATPVAEVAGLLGWWNVLIAAFNLVPGAPLDGGRVLRALLWMLLGDRLRALRASVRAGQLVGIALMLLGGWILSRSLAAWLPAAAFVLVGAFLFRAARAELRHAELDAVMSGRRVVDLVGPPPAPVHRDESLATLDLSTRAGGADLLGVVDAGRLIGLLEVATIEAMHPTDRSVRRAGDLAEPLGEVPTVDVDDDLHTLVDRFQGPHHVVGVTAQGELVGALTEREVARALVEVRRTGRLDPADGQGIAAQRAPEVRQ